MFIQFCLNLSIWMCRFDMVIILGFLMCTFLKYVHLLISVTTTSATMTLETGDVKLISSPRWPENYPYYTYRSFTVYAPQNSIVKLEVLDLHLRSSCSYDTLTIYDGKTIHLIRYELFSIKYNVPMQVANWPDSFCKQKWQYCTIFNKATSLWRECESNAFIWGSCNCILDETMHLR